MWGCLLRLLEKKLPVQPSFFSLRAGKLLFFSPPALSHKGDSGFEPLNFSEAFVANVGLL